MVGALLSNELCSYRGILDEAKYRLEGIYSIQDNAV